MSATIHNVDGLPTFNELVAFLLLPDEGEAAPNLDAELLPLCAEFMSLDAHMRRFDQLGDGPERMTEEKIGAIGLELDALVPRITAISARTVQGLKAKAEVAFWLLRTADEIECEEWTALARSALADVMRSASA